MSTRDAAMLILAPLSGESLSRLRETAHRLHIVQYPASGADVTDDLWRRTEVLYTAHFLPRAEQVPTLRWIQLYSAGVDGVLEHPLFNTSVIITTTSGIHPVPIAEFVFGSVLTWSRRLTAVRADQQRRYWPSTDEKDVRLMPTELWGMTIGIVGYGSIGRQVARVAAGFGMRILAMQRGDDRRERGFYFPGTGDAEGALPAKYYPLTELRDLLRESDLVVIALPLTPETRGLFDERAFQSMKRSAYLVNVARGSICDEGALARALREGRIAGAALDVFEQEPLPPDHPFWAMPNVLVSPHISGISPRYAERAGLIFEENVRRYCSSEPLYNQVNKEHRY